MTIFILQLKVELSSNFPLTRSNQNCKLYPQNTTARPGFTARLALARSSTNAQYPNSLLTTLHRCHTTLNSHNLFTSPAVNIRMRSTTSKSPGCLSNSKCLMVKSIWIVRNWRFLFLFIFK